ncbi:MAG: hypothetical protein KDD92_08945 [Caldilineaceae bacterium]|nr:hypothetical protein [Caldilineaceae bacterium]
MLRMTRTRITFFSVVGLMVIILMISLATQSIAVQALSQLFIAATIFSVAVVTIDMLGLLGGESGDGAHGGDSGDFDAGDVDAGDFDAGDAAIDHAGDGEIAVTGGEDIGPGDTHTGYLGDQGNPVLSALTYLRMFVYFCLGFGPVGWFALNGGWNPAMALLLAAGVGVIAVFIAQAFFRFQRSDTDSSIRNSELLQRPATVLIGLSDTSLGRVRVQIGMSVLEPHALAARPGRFVKGDAVRIVRVEDDCVYVE